MEMFENETLTIKRLEVAIRNNDDALLKEATYKLHEKYHAGYDFKMLSELENILNQAKSSDIGADILEILCPTIEEILGNFKAVPTYQINENDNATNNYSENISVKNDYVENSYAENDYIKNDYVENGNQHIALFFDEDNFGLSDSIFSEYHTKLCSLSNNKNSQTEGISDDITNIIEFATREIEGFGKILCKVAQIDKSFSFITTSANPNLTKYFTKNNIGFKIPLAENTYLDNSFCDFIPMFGLCNLFVCPSCGAKFLNKNDDITPISIKCASCGQNAYIDIYDLASNIPNCNPIYWHRAFHSFANSNVWVLINPPESKDKEAIYDFLKMVSKSFAPKRIYLLEKGDIYRKLFLENCPKAQLIHANRTLEELFENLKAEDLITA